MEMKIRGHGAPDKNTVGAVDQLYIDLDTGKVYKCEEIHEYVAKDVNETIYVWKNYKDDSANINSEAITDFRYMFTMQGPFYSYDEATDTETEYYIYPGKELLEMPNFSFKGGVYFDYAFLDNDDITKIDLDAPNGEHFDNTFSGCTSLKELYIHTDKNVDLATAFYNCFSLSKVTAVLNNCESINELFRGLKQLTDVNLSADKCTDFSLAFNNCTSLTSIAINTSNGTNFKSMFSNCSALTTVPNIDTSKGTDFFGMFSGCKSLTTMPNINTSNGTNFGYMFNFCTALTNASDIDTSKGTNFSYMFTNCALTTVPNIDTSKGTNFASMFTGCKGLTTVLNINTSNGTILGNMFYGCDGITDIAIDMSKATNYSTTFTKCTALKNLSITSVKIKDNNFDLTTCTSLTAESLVSILEALQDNTGETQYTVKLGATNLAKLTADQKAIATNKNINLS